MLERGEVALDDPVSLYLPASVKVPRNGGGEITLRQLATHTSGLPRMPANFSPADPANPYADYGTERMFEFIAASHPKDSAPGMADYSNLGFGLLGVALANRAGTDYATLLQARVLDPLGMKDTAIVVKGDMARRRATGHSPELRPVSAWDFDAFAGAGAIRSTMNDLLKFAAAELGLVSTPLDAAMRASQRPAGSAGRQGLAWIILLEGERLTHSGMTGGFASEMILDVKRKKAVVVLSNAQVSNFDIALHAMDSRNPVVSR
jgi:CubicO group peptidase (beta-lactamase class C family)